MSYDAGPHDGAPSPLGNTQTREDLVRAVVEAAQAEIWTSLPVIVSKKSADGHTVNLKSALRIPRRLDDGTVVYDELPEFEEVPINFSGGGGMTHTFPLNVGDEGWADFSARGQGVWRANGGVQQPQDTQTHALSDARFRPGARSDPRKLPDYNTEAQETRSDDGKQRVISHPKNGTKVSNNGGKQVLDVNAVSGAIQAYSKTLTLAAGTPPTGGAPNTTDTINRDLNEQLKGLAARVGHMEKTTAALFDVTSQFRAIAQTQIPALAAIAPLLSGDPAGLTATVSAVEGKAMAYLQTQIQQALSLFLNPTLGNIGSVLSGGIEGLIQALTAQIAQLVASNPVVAQVEGLQRQIDGILARTASPDVQAAALAPIQAQIDALAKGNPIIGQVQGLRSQLQGLLGQAGAAGNFLEPQQRLAKGQLKSMHLAE